MTSRAATSRRGRPDRAIHARVSSEAGGPAASTRLSRAVRWLSTGGPAGDPPLATLELGVPVAGGAATSACRAGRACRRGAGPRSCHVGPYRSETEPDLAAGRATLEAWADAQGLARGDYVEHYLKGPVAEPDHARWETELAYLTTA